MQTPWGLIKTHDAPDAQGVPCLLIEHEYDFLSVSLGGHEATPDDCGCGVDVWIPDNDNEAPFAWRERRPTI